MLRSIFITLLTLVSTTSAQVGLMSAHSSGKGPENKVGINIGGILDGETAWEFADLLRRTNWLVDFGHRQSKNITESAQDQIAGSFGNVWVRSTGPGDVYKLRIRNKSNYTLPGNGTFVINGSGTFTADADVQFATSVDATVCSISATDGNTVFELWAPGEEPPPETGSPTWLESNGQKPEHKFHSVFVGLLKNFGCIRALNWLPINRKTQTAPILTVADLANPDLSTQASVEFGAALSHFLDLCEVCNADAWIPFPHTAQPDLITNWVNQLSAWRSANPGRKVYLEFSNECWNGQFKQAREPNTSAVLHPYAMETIGAGIWPAESADRQRALAYGRKSAEFFAFIDTIWAPSNYISCVSWQAGANSTPPLMLDEFIATYGGPPDAYTVAPYLTWAASQSVPSTSGGRNNIVRDAITLLTGKVGNESVLTDAEKLIVDDWLVEHWPAERMLDLMQNLEFGETIHGVGNSRDWMVNHQAHADARNIPLFLTYEDGQHLQPSNGHANAFPKWGAQYLIAQQSPRMQLILEDHYRSWQEVTNGDLRMYLSFIQEPRGDIVNPVPDGFGAFGHLDTMFPPDTDNPKWKAIFDETVRRRR